jgi:hypothetical protein
MSRRGKGDGGGCLLIVAFLALAGFALIAGPLVAAGVWLALEVRQRGRPKPPGGFTMGGALTRLPWLCGVLGRQRPEGFGLGVTGASA